MKQNSKRLTSMLVALLLVVGALIAYFDLLTPAYNNLETEKGQEISEQQLLTNEQQLVKQVQALVTTYQSQAQSDQSVNIALPTNADVAGGLSQLYGLATVNDISIQSVGVSVQAVTPQPSQAPVTDEITAVAAGGSILQPIGTISFDVSATGSYENLKAFLQGLQTNLRLFDLKSIAVAKAGGSNQDNFQYTITVVTYYQGS